MNDNRRFFIPSTHNQHSLIDATPTTPVLERAGSMHEKLECVFFLRITNRREERPPTNMGQWCLLLLLAAVVGVRDGGRTRKRGGLGATDLKARKQPCTATAVSAILVYTRTANKSRVRRVRR